MAWIAGILAGRHLPVPTTGWLVAAAAGAAGAGVLLAWRHLRGAALVCVAGAIVSCGAVRVRLDLHHTAGDDVAAFLGPGARPATVRGHLAGAPRIWRDASAPPWRDHTRMSAILAVDGILSAPRGRGRWLEAQGRLRVAFDRADTRLTDGDEVELKGWLGGLSPPANPGGHDWAQTYRCRGIFARLSVEDASAVRILTERDSSPWVAWVRRLRSLVRTHVAGCGPTRDAQLLGAMVIGERDPALRDLNEAMVEAGVAHFLSISGLHLGIFVGFVYLLCRLLQVGQRRAAAVVLVVLAAYVLVAEPRPALLRSAVMAAALCLAVLVGRRYDALNVLAGAAVVLLAVWPGRLFEPGFQMSFCIVAGMLALHGPVRDTLFGRWLRWRGLMVFRGPGAAWRRVRRALADVLISATTLAVTAFLASAPLVAWHFGRFSPYAAVLSVLLLPLVVAVLVPGYVSIFLAAWAPNLAHLVGQAAARAAAWLREVVGWFQGLPGLTFELRPVGLWWVASCYALLTLLAWHRRLRWGRTILTGACVVLAGLTAYTQRTADPPRGMQLDVLSIGAGQCAVLRTPSGQTFLLDAGSLSRMDAAETTLRPFLRQMRLPYPCQAFVSHANTDHYNALPDLTRVHPLEKVYVHDTFGQSAREGSEVAGLLSALQKAQTRVVRLAAGDTLRLDAQTQVEVLWPPADRPENLKENDASLVLRITCAGRRLLITGDIQEAAQTALLAKPDRLRADVMILPHHGGWDRTLPDLVDAVGPKTVLVSTNHPLRGPAGRNEAAATFFDRLRRERDVYSTRVHGWVRVQLDAEGVRVQTMR